MSTESARAASDAQMASAARSLNQEASVACSTAIALEWDVAFKNLNDPSVRAVAGVHEQAY